MRLRNDFTLAGTSRAEIPCTINARAQKINVHFIVAKRISVLPDLRSVVEPQGPDDGEVK